MNRQTGDLMKSTITRAILLVAPVIDALQEQESVRGCLISELEALLKG